MSLLNLALRYKCAKIVVKLDEKALVEILKHHSMGDCARRGLLELGDNRQVRFNQGLLQR